MSKHQGRAHARGRNQVSFDYDVVDNWDGESPASYNKTKMLKNHDSTMPKDEVLRLAKQGVELLLKQPLRSIQDTKDKELRKAWDDVQNGKSRTCIIRVWKGIHQRTTKPHLTARIVGASTLHFWLSDVSTNLTTLPGFTYAVVAVSATEKGGIVPNVALVGIKRRGSICLDVLTTEQRRLAAPVVL
jgi:hypothetical protein